jgi:hypothetical protein
MFFESAQVKNECSCPAPDKMDLMLASLDIPKSGKNILLVNTPELAKVYRACSSNLCSKNRSNSILLL